jgi:hypothetical protein
MTCIVILPAGDVRSTPPRAKQWTRTPSAARVSTVDRTSRALRPKLSAITVEYDVRDDEAERSKVFRLEPASDELIQKLIERRHPDVSGPARRRLAEFAGGNARIALALAQTVVKTETLGDLSDEQLFVRLFNQRKPEDTGLLQSAEAISLIYSFDGVALDGEAAELPILALLAGTNVETLHRHIAELRRRNLVQCRSRWRAVLPHALTNRLAKRAFENLPRTTIEGIFTAAPPRLLKSFSRRLASFSVDAFSSYYHAQVCLLQRPLFWVKGSYIVPWLALCLLQRLSVLWFDLMH